MAPRFCSGHFTSSRPLSPGCSPPSTFSRQLWATSPPSTTYEKLYNSVSSADRPPVAPPVAPPVLPPVMPPFVPPVVPPVTSPSTRAGGGKKVLRGSIVGAGGDGGLVARLIGHALDCVVYCFLPLLCALLLRVFQGRDLLARIGGRTLVKTGAWVLVRVQEGGSGIDTWRRVCVGDRRHSLRAPAAGGVRLQTVCAQLLPRM